MLSILFNQEKLIPTKFNYYFLDFGVFKIWKVQKGVFSINFCYNSLPAITLYFSRNFKNDLISFDLVGTWETSLSFCLVEIDVHGSLSNLEFLRELACIVSSSKNDPNSSFSHWLNLQLFLYIITAFEYCYVETRTCFNANRTSYL